MGVLADIEWAGNTLGTTPLTDRLADRQDMILVEGGLERRATMAGGAKSDLLLGDGRVGRIGIVSRNQAWEVDEQIAGRWLAGKGMGTHSFLSSLLMWLGTFGK